MEKDRQWQGVDEEEVIAGEGAAQDGEEDTAAAENHDNVADEECCGGDPAEKMAAEAAQWRDKYLRLQAEFDNFRKRTLREKMELVTAGGEDVIKVLLPVLDDFDRALSAMETASDVTAVKEGVVLIANKLRDTLASKGVSEIEAIGRELDTDFHEAVAKIPAQKRSERGKVVDCVQKGYKLNDKVIRHSKVVVGE